MVLPTSFAEARTRSVRLAERTSLRIGGVPEYLFEPEDEEQAAAVLSSCRREGVPVRVLGGGSNLLIDDGTLPGAVIATHRLRGLAVMDEKVIASAGVPFPTLVTRAARWGLPGLSGCPGIPGTVGGAVAMNAGGRFGTTADALVEVRGLDLDGRRFRRRIQPGDLGYRESVFEGRFITQAVFRRDPALDPVTEAETFRCALEAKRASQPLGAATTGCSFRNPPSGPSAGRLIEDAGLKGRRVGGAAVSTRHANFLVNEGRATAGDVRTLLDLVREEVRLRFGVDLVLEVRVWS